jgi:hypothetical protein
VELPKIFVPEFWPLSTLDLEMNWVPFAVSVKSSKPPIAFDGDKDVMAQSGLGETIENVAALEVPPLGV